MNVPTVTTLAEVPAGDVCHLPTGEWCIRAVRAPAVSGNVSLTDLADGTDTELTGTTTVDYYPSASLQR